MFARKTDTVTVSVLMHIIFERIVLNICPYFVIILLISDSVIIKGFLPNGPANLFRNRSFELLYYP